MDELTVAINEWLLTYEPITEIAETIYTEELPEDTQTLALQRNGVESLPFRYITEKGWYRQYQYILLLKTNSEDNNQRIDNLDWLDKLSDWIDVQNKNNNYPVLSEDKKVDEVSCANALTYETNENGATSIYYLQIYFNIKKT